MTTPETNQPTADTHTVMRPGTTVYDVHGDRENPEDTGTIFSVEEGGYSIVWNMLGSTPKFAAFDEVTAMPGQGNTGLFPEHPDDVAGRGVVRNYYACQSHCCASHGCKYGFKGCPVTTGLVVQDYSCEDCTYALDDSARWTGVGYAQPGEIGKRVTFGLRREDKTMTDMPTDQQVAAAVAEALAGLSINGWSLTRVLGTDVTADGAADDDWDDEDE